MDKAPKPYPLASGVWMVPCQISASQSEYKPVVKPFDKDIYNLYKNDNRQSWTPAEDEILKQIIHDKGPNHWSVIAFEVNSAIHNGMPIRKGKQCRERWLGHLDPKIVKQGWNNEEDFVLVTKQMVFGNKWSQISKFLPGRTENQIKNRWRRIDKITKKLIWKWIKAENKDKGNFDHGFIQFPKFPIALDNVGFSTVLNDMKYGG